MTGIDVRINHCCPYRDPSVNLRASQLLRAGEVQQSGKIGIVNLSISFFVEELRRKDVKRRRDLKQGFKTRAPLPPFQQGSKANGNAAPSSKLLLR